MNDPQSFPLDPAFFIEINGMENALAMGHADNGFIVSDIFNVRKNIPAGRPSPVMFRWQSGTPAGTQIIQEGSVIATYPNLPANNLFTSDFSFRLAVPEGSDPTLAGVEVVGIHNNYAGRVWEGRSSTNPAQFQTMLFYIPRLIATASMTDTPEPPPNGNGPTTPQPTPTAVRIQKIDALTRERIPGALVRLRGMSSHQVVTGDGQIWELDNTGINISQVLTAGAATAVPGDVTHEIEDGLWTITDLPFGFYMVEEERAPQGYSLLPQHTAYGFWLLPPNVIVEADGTPIVCPVTGEVLYIEIDYEITEIGGVNSILLTFENYPFGSIELTKLCDVTNQPIAGAVFRIEGYFAEGNPGGIPTYRMATTDASGRIRWDDLPAGMFAITETHAPAGYILSSETVTVPITWGQTATVIVTNTPMSSLEVLKIDGDTSAPLAGAIFMLRDPTTGETWQATTGADGIAVFGRGSNGNELYPGRTYILTEIQAPSGYVLVSAPQEIVLSPGDNNRVTVRNLRMPTITIQKRDAVTGNPIANAEFTIEKIDNPGRGMLTGNPFRTDANGQIVLPYRYAGTYRIIETRAARNYWLDPLEQNRSWTIQVRENEDYLLIVENTMLPTLVITKMNALTNRPVPLTHFRVEFEVPNSANVRLIGNFVTDRNGQIIIPFVDVGWYRITETRAAPGMALNVNNNYRVFLNPGDNTYKLLDRIMGMESPTPIDPDSESEPTSTPPTPDDDLDNMTDEELVQFLTRNIQVTDGDSHLTGENIWNWPLNSIVIKKSCAVTGQLLQGATFELIHTSAGESGTRGTVIGRFTTNHSGIIVITGLVPGSYVVEEVIPPTNFTLSVNNTQHVFLRPDGHSIVEVEFSNSPYGSLLITKRCEVTGRPLQNTEFRVTNSSGAVVGTANGLFRTNQQGEILISNLRPDSYIVTEVTAPDGFVLDGLPQTIRVNATGNIYRVDFTNRPHGGLQILKLCDDTRRPIPDTEFAVAEMNGRRIGTFRTDSQGLIILPELNSGWFTVTETRAADGFLIDTTAHNIEMTDGQTATLTITNRRASGIHLQKIDAITRAPIFGVEFMLFDSNNRVVGTFHTDNNGIIDFFGIEPGRYTIRETRAAPGYYLDEMPRTVEFRAGQVTEIIWENTPQMGQIQILKRSGDDNEINGLPA